MSARRRAAVAPALHRASLMASRSLRARVALLFTTACIGAPILLAACSDSASTLPTRARATRQARGGAGSAAGDEGDTEESDRASPTRAGSSASPSGTVNNPGDAPGPSTDTTPPKAAPELGVEVTTPAIALNMQATQSTDVIITAKNYAGPVKLSVTGLPEGAKYTFSDQNPVVDASGIARSKLTVSSGPSSAGDSLIKIVATAGDVAQESPARVTVNSRVVITIPQNASTNSKNFDVIPLTAGDQPIDVVFENPTGEAVIIHRGNPGVGFSHGDPIAPGSSEIRRVSGRGFFEFYVHDGRDEANKGALDIK